MVKLLVADDEQKICRLLESFFAERGFNVLLAHDGKGALSCIRSERPHLVFLDLHMPGLNGLDVLKEARAVDETMKIIVITAIEDEEIIRKAKSLGAADYVIKPFSLEYLRDEVLTKVSTSLYEDLRASNEELKRSLEEMRGVTRGVVSAFSLVVSKIDPHYTHRLRRCAGSPAGSSRRSRWSSPRSTRTIPTSTFRGAWSTPPRS
ncbi:MAG: response regulator [Candidatus Omnitrophica bacterium]|nr:response regulator [Candidatus Omnitrophota bacterium]